MRNRSKIMILAAAISGLLLMPATAFAAYTPSGDDFITCIVEGGDEVSCNTGIWDPGTIAKWLAEYNPTIASGEATVDADGVAAFSFDASGVPEGSEITVTVNGIKDGQPKTLAKVAATVDEEGELASTGSEAGLLALGAFAALAVGGAALFVSRRKRTTV